MPSGRYAPLPNPSSAPDAEREMADAFNLDDEDEENDHEHSESTPLTRNVPRSATAHDEAESSSTAMETSAIGRSYDFEREYDFPPPGSPPKPSSRALPNDYGNSNGFLPTAPIARPVPKQSIFRRAMGAILPTHYQPLSTTDESSSSSSGGRVLHVGGGTENDGVFANVTAKPQPVRTVRTEDGDVHIVPEDNQKEAPPSYQEAQADAVPPYWETTIHAPLDGSMGNDLIIDDLPTGSFLIFCLNTFISFFFQFVGFLLTYLLHTSHAAKYGSRAGLGLTLIQYGLYSRMKNEDDALGAPNGNDQATDIWGKPLAPPSPTASTEFSSAVPSPAPTPNDTTMASASNDWLSFIFMTLGWFLLLSSIIGFWRIKRWEKSIRAPAANTQPTQEQYENDVHLRHRLESVFGISFEAPPGVAAGSVAGGNNNVNGNGAANAVVIQRGDFYHNNPAIPVTPDESRLARDLRAAGLL